MKEKGMSKGEFNSVAQVNGGLNNMINWDGKDKDLLALIKYIAEYVSADGYEPPKPSPVLLRTHLVHKPK